MIPFLAVMAAGVVIACLGYQSFVTNLTNFLDVLLVIFIPWSAVNLADYFLVRRGNYDVASFFTADGAYGRFAWRGLLAYAIGLAAEWPFVSQPDYTGPLVKHPRRRRHLLARRLVRRGHRLPAPGRPDPRQRPPRPAGRHHRQIAVPADGQPVQTLCWLVDRRAASPASRWPPAVAGISWWVPVAPASEEPERTGGFLE